MSAETKLICGCYATRDEADGHRGWIVTAEAFLCDARHRQGDFIPDSEGVLAAPGVVGDA